MVNHPVSGNKYWCIRPSREDYNDNNDREPQTPWQGILQIAEYRMILYRFDENNKIDNDTNASAIVINSNLFEHEQEAQKHYKEKCLEYAEELMETALEFLKEGMT